MEEQRLQFLRLVWPHAQRVEKEYGFPAVAIVAQAVAESGWKIPQGNMMFGVKDTDGINGNEQLIRTKEILDNPFKKFPVVHSVTPFQRGGKTYYRYDVETYFRKYDTPYESFRDHAEFLLRNPRYKDALGEKDPRGFLRRIARAGYATALNYEDYLMTMVSSIERRLPKLGTQAPVDQRSQKS